MGLSIQHRFFTYSFKCLYFDIKDRANEIYKKVEDQKPLRGRNQDAIVAACLYIACRQEDKPRTVKGIVKALLSTFCCLSVFICLNFKNFLLVFQLEICSVANGATKKEIGRAKEFIVKQLEVEMGLSIGLPINAGDFLVSLPYPLFFGVAPL